MKKITLSGMAILSLFLTACMSEATHMRVCAKQTVNGIVAMEPDACDEDDDDYDRRARWFYVPNDERYSVWRSLGVGDTVPGGTGSFTQPRGNNVSMGYESDG